jgi:deazaflavin-dependent oxidoreductase (nitroreductase family)
VASTEDHRVAPHVAGLERTRHSRGQPFHKALLRRFGRVRLVGGDTLVLTTRGWKTGRETSTPLFYARADGRILIAASFAGRGTPPSWHRNLAASLEVRATIEGDTRPYRARTLTPAEADDAWPKLIAVYPTFTRYRNRARLPIPVVELSPEHADRDGRSTGIEAAIELRAAAPLHAGAATGKPSEAAPSAMRRS